MNNLAPNYLSELITPYNQDRYPTKGKFQHRYNNPPIFKKNHMENALLHLLPLLNGTNFLLKSNKRPVLILSRKS